MSEPTTAEIIERASERFADRAAIEAAGYVPGWHGEPVTVGDLAVMHGHGQWRTVIVTKVTGTLVHGVFTTPSAIEYAQRVQASYLAMNLDKRGEQVAAQERQNHRYYVNEVGPNPLHGKYRTAEELARMQSYVDEGMDAYVSRHVAKQRADDEARQAEAREGWHRWVNTAKATGRRDGRQTNLYVRP